MAPALQAFSGDVCGLFSQNSRVFPKADVAEGVQHLRGSMTAMRDKTVVHF
jgi:hypothetical protein